MIFVIFLLIVVLLVLFKDLYISALKRFWVKYNPFNASNKPPILSFKDNIKPADTPKPDVKANLEPYDEEFEKLSDDLAKTVNEIKVLVPTFSVKNFLSSALNLFEHLFNTFTNSKISEIEHFLSKEFYDKFAKTLADRPDMLSVNNILVRMNSFDIQSIEKVDSVVFLRIYADYNYISYIQDKEEVVSGSKTDVLQGADILEFCIKIENKQAKYYLNNILSI